MPNFTVVLFDLDGTLIDTNHLIVTSYQHVFRTQLGREVAPEELYPYFGEPLDRTMTRFGADRAAELVHHYRAYNADQHDALIRQFPGVREAVVALHQAGLPMGIVTSKMTQVAVRGMEACHLAGFFSVLVGADSTTRHKPDPEPVLLALRQLGVEPGPHVLMVGDSHFDMQCGRSAGVKTAAVGWAVNRTQLRDAQPDYWMETPAELAELILGPR